METRRRTLVKAGGWNLIGLAVMSVIGWAATGSAGLGGKMALLNTAAGLVCYVLYERLWTRIGWGRAHG